MKFFLLTLLLASIAFTTVQSQSRVTLNENRRRSTTDKLAVISPTWRFNAFYKDWRQSFKKQCLLRTIPNDYNDYDSSLLIRFKFSTPDGMDGHNGGRAGRLHDFEPYGGSYLCPYELRGRSGKERLRDAGRDYQLTVTTREATMLF